MLNKNKTTLFFIGLALGIFLALAGGMCGYKILKLLKSPGKREAIKRLFQASVWQGNYKQIIESFSKPMTAEAGKSFGKNKQLTFELYRGGTFVIDGQSGFAWQKSDSYRDSAFIRSTNALPKTYKVSVVVGDIDYGLEKIEGLPQDPEYSEGPQNENGCYLLAITDEAPIGHHTNIWWHQHRKVVIDVDNNVWGHGMPDPIFMVYFDRDNKLVSFSENENTWQSDWVKAVTYEPKQFYKVEIEKTKKKIIMSIYNNKGMLLKRVSVDLKDIWHDDEYHSDYLVVGDPHENYYQGSMKIKSIAVSVK